MSLPLPMSLMPNILRPCGESTQCDWSAKFSIISVLPRYKTVDRPDVHQCSFVRKTWASVPQLPVARHAQKSANTMPAGSIGSHPRCSSKGEHFVR